MDPGTQRALVDLARLLPSRLKELSQAISSLTEVVKPKDDLVAIDMETEGVKPVVLHLTANEWVDLLCAIQSKRAGVDQGQYDKPDGEDDREAWVKRLKVLEESIQQQGEQQGIAF